MAGLAEAVRFHDLRHYLASLRIGSGLGVKVVQHRLRHGSATTTLDTYGHLCQTATGPHGPPLVLCWRRVRTRRGRGGPRLRVVRHRQRGADRRARPRRRVAVGARGFRAQRRRVRPLAGSRFG
ncbi:tyrosine-type recombinase/integrase [Blastococcus mobilis]|uniref:tyrosine-type recombinase/integrase n=1 Tax=Blastococcus mobilis TaxID=1938746 RepID=UPI0034A0B7FF